jgi:Ser/Thr protein kinase RdoA (MazF antagonist)
MPGAADYEQAPSRKKLEAALVALAEFHRAAASFPLPDVRHVRSPGIAERHARMASLDGGGLDRLTRAVEEAARGGLARESWPELDLRARELLTLFPRGARKVAPLVASSLEVRVALQPAIRDIWHDHVLFIGSEVSGLVDFGAMRPENVAADVARLLGSLAADDSAAWQAGLAAYQTVRPLADAELLLAEAFDRTTTLLGGLQWLEWIYVEGRQFANRTGVLKRIDALLARLAVVVGG